MILKIAKNLNRYISERIEHQEHEISSKGLHDQIADSENEENSSFYNLNKREPTATSDMNEEMYENGRELLNNKLN